MICADKRFEPFFRNKILANSEAFIYKEEPHDFLPYYFIPTKESITDCSSLILYQSSLVYIPE